MSSRAHAFRACLRAGSFRSGAEREPERRQRDGQRRKKRQRSPSSPTASRAPRRSSPSTTAGSASPRPPSCGAGWPRPTPCSRWSRTGSPSAPPRTPAPTAIDELLVGPTALTLIKGDAVVAAKAIVDFAREHEELEYKGGIMDGEALDPEGFTAIARLPGLDVLHGQLVGLTASPLTGLVAGLDNDLRPRAPARPDRRAGPGHRRAPAAPAEESPGRGGARRGSAAEEEAADRRGPRRRRRSEAADETEQARRGAGEEPPPSTPKRRRSRGARGRSPPRSRREPAGTETIRATTREQDGASGNAS